MPRTVISGAMLVSKGAPLALALCCAIDTMPWITVRLAIRADSIRNTVASPIATPAVTGLADSVAPAARPTPLMPQANGAITCAKVLLPAQS